LVTDISGRGDRPDHVIAHEDGEHEDGEAEDEGVDRPAGRRMGGRTEAGGQLLGIGMGEIGGLPGALGGGIGLVEKVLGRIGHGGLP
jgi:hypothetical protein